MKTNEIYQGDCLDLLPEIPDKSIDMILCDLPYGTTECSWDSIIDMGKLWEQYERIIKDNGAIVLTANSVFTFKLWSSNPKIYRYKWTWYKGGTTGFLNANVKPFTVTEDVLIFYNTKPTYNPQKTKCKPYTRVQYGATDVYRPNRHYQKATVNEGLRFPEDILFIEHDKNRQHPTQKPVALFEYLIKTYTNEGEIVLDNCSGSGTTAIACLNSNRRFICMEKDETYYKKSLDRLANHEPLLYLGSTNEN